MEKFSGLAALASANQARLPTFVCDNSIVLFGQFAGIVCAHNVCSCPAFRGLVRIRPVRLRRHDATNSPAGQVTRKARQHLVDLMCAWHVGDVSLHSRKSQVARKW